MDPNRALAQAYLATTIRLIRCCNKASRSHWPSSIIRGASISLGAGAICSGLLLFETAAHAQTGEAVAESLFRDGKQLFQADDFEHACQKLAQSYQIDPAGGTALLLATCYEKQGKLASAWARYSDALALARRDSREDRERRAREGLDSVEPKLSYINLKLDSATQAITGVTLSLDGTELPAISDARLPVDAGKHQLTIRAPNYEPWHAEVTVGGPSVTETIDVPMLQSKPVAAAPTTLAQPPQFAPISAGASQQPQERVPNRNIRNTAYVIGGVGLAALAVGSYFGVRAIRLNNDANNICPTQQCTQEKGAAIPKSADALSNAHLADAFIGIGSAVTISAAILWYAYRNDPPAATPYAVIIPNAVSMGWRQSF